MSNVLFDREHKEEKLPEKALAMDLSAITGNETAGAEEHYGGPMFKELYPEQLPADWDHTRGSVKNVATRLFLQQVRECRRSIELLERRKKYRISAGLSADDLEIEQNAAKEKLSALTVTIADEISKIGNTSQEMVLAMRYIDLKSWDEIAETMDMRVRTVLKFHGYGLVHLRDVLTEDGIIQEATDEQTF